MILKYALPLALTISFSSLSFAASTNTNFESSATLNPKCSISGNRIDFGDISPKRNGYVQATSNILTTCTKQTSYNIIIGSGNSGDPLSRKLKSNNSSNQDGLSYFIYKNADFTSLLGDGTNGTSTLDGTGNGFIQNLAIYGHLPLNQYIKADYYSDNLTVTINY